MALVRASLLSWLFPWSSGLQKGYGPGKPPRAQDPDSVLGTEADAQVFLPLRDDEPCVAVETAGMHTCEREGIAGALD